DAVLEERLELRPALVRGELERSVRRVRRPGRAFQADSELALELESDDSERGAAQPEGVLAPGRNQAEAEEPDQRVDPVRERGQPPDASARQRIVGAGGQVLIVDRLPDRL